MPKEMLPIVDKPAIQYVVEEAAGCVLHDVLIITGRNKENLQNHFYSVPELEHTLRQKGDLDKLELVHSASDVADVHFLRQGQPLGLGHAVARARMHVDEQPFAVLLGDDLIDARDPLLATMIAEAEKRQATVIALMEVPLSQIHLYGAASVQPTDSENVVRVTSLIEKPSAEDAPSNLAIIGRYVLQPTIFDILDEQQPGRGNEIQLTDALNVMAQDENQGVFGVIFRGRRYDTGDRSDWVKANIQLAVENQDFGKEFRNWLIGFADGLQD